MGGRPAPRLWPIAGGNRPQLARDGHYLRRILPLQRLGPGVYPLAGPGGAARSSPCGSIGRMPHPGEAGSGV